MLNFLKAGFKVFLTNLGFFSPYEINFAITYRCNSKCKICNIWRRRQLNELKLNEIKELTEKIGFIHWVRLTGGETFLRQDYVEIVKLFDKNLDLYLLTTPTNGLNSDLILKKVREVLKFFKKRYVITVSLDGPKKIHNKIRGSKIAWDSAIKTFLELKELEKNYKNFKVLFGYTISPYNLGAFEKTLEEVKKIMPKITANDFHINLFQASDIYYCVKDIKKKDYSKKARKEIDVILSLREKKFGIIDMIERKYLELGKKYLKSGKTPLSCNIFNLSCFIDPAGNVYPCTVFNRKLGNLRDFNYDLKKILTSEKAKKVREEIVQNKCPQCWTPCEAHQMILSNCLGINLKNQNNF
jgi:radical SAM protein with 4Fe4S-binding SPASM domain